jgi:hypothetical protein
MPHIASRIDREVDAISQARHSVSVEAHNHDIPPNTGKVNTVTNHENTSSISYPSTSDGTTALQKATRHGDVAKLRRLVQASADINARRTWTDSAQRTKRPAKPSWLWTPLHYAFKSNNGDAIQYLIDSGADMNSESLCSETSLNVAFRMQNGVSMWVLIQNSADYTLDKYTPSQSGSLPNWAVDKITRRKMPKSLIAQLESHLLQQFARQNPGGSLSEGSYCGRCRGKVSEERKKEASDTMVASWSDIQLRVSLTM